MSSKSEGGRLQAVFGSMVNTIDTLKGSKPRLLIFASAFVMIVMSLFVGPYSGLLVLSGIVVFFILVIDLARGGTIAD